MRIIEINLLPPEEAPESLYSIRNIAILVISFVLAICLIVLALQMNSLKDEYVQRKEKLLQRLAVYKIQKEKIDELQKKKADLEQRYKLITDVLGKRITWYDKLSVIHRQIPENMWLSQVLMEFGKAEEFQTKIRKNVSPSKKTSNPQDLEKNEPLIFIRILGYTPELPKIGELMANLDNSLFLEKTKFKRINNQYVSKSGFKY